MIKIDFTKTDGTYTFNDAIWLEDDHALSVDDIEAMKQKRFDDWLAIVTAPSLDDVLDTIEE